MEEDNKIAMMTDSGYTVIDRREICAITRVLKEEMNENNWNTIEIHMNSGTIFTTNGKATVGELWNRSRWGAGVWEEEE